MDTDKNTDHGVRLARAADYPAKHLIGLETRVQTGDDFHDAFDIAERALGEEVPQGSLFAYLFRRFGHPNKGSDPDKDLVSYLLTTTHPGMLLRVTPYAGGNTTISFCFMVPHETHRACGNWVTRKRDAHDAAFLDWIEAQGRVPDWADEVADGMGNGGWPIPAGMVGWRRMMTGLAMLAHLGVKEGDPADKATAIAWYESVRADHEAAHPVPPPQWRREDVAAWDDADPMKPYAEAMAATLRDLLRPVWIRDVAIDINGTIDESDPEAFERAGPDADAAIAAGYPSGDLGNVDPVGFSELHGAVLRLDPDPVAAIARAVELLTASQHEPEATPAEDAH